MAKYRVTTDGGTYEVTTDEPDGPGDAAPPQSWTDQLGDAASHFWGALKGAADPHNGVMGLMRALDNTGDELKAARESIQSGDHDMALAHVVRAVPILGPLAKSVRENISEGHYGAAVGDVGGLLAVQKAAEALPKAIEGAPNAAKIAKDTVKGAAKGIAEEAPNIANYGSRGAIIGGLAAGREGAEFGSAIGGAVPAIRGAIRGGVKGAARARSDIGVAEHRAAFPGRAVTPPPTEPQPDISAIPGDLPSGRKVGPAPPPASPPARPDPAWKSIQPSAPSVTDASPILGSLPSGRVPGRMPTDTPPPAPQPVSTMPPPAPAPAAPPARPSLDSSLANLRSKVEAKYPDSFKAGKNLGEASHGSYPERYDEGSAAPKMPAPGTRVLKTVPKNSVLANNPKALQAAKEMADQVEDWSQ